MERRDLASLPAYAHELASWRQRLVGQFESEARGPKWVVDDKLVVRPTGQTYGPNFPQAPQAKPGDRIIVAPNEGGTDCRTNDCWQLGGVGHGRGSVQQGAYSVRIAANHTVLRLLGTSGSGLCLTARNVQADANLTIDACAPPDSPLTAQFFATANHSTGEPPNLMGVSMTAASAAAITHVPTGLCVTAPETQCPGCSASLLSCAPASAPLASRQLWLFGASGRLCAIQYNSLCLHVDAQWPSWQQMPLP